ncbi:hypothetical protein pb186bvf_016953 [Paramecium bursaria]
MQNNKNIYFQSIYDLKQHQGQQNYLQQDIYIDQTINDKIPRLPNNVSLQFFRDNFECTNQPCIIQNLNHNWINWEWKQIEMNYQNTYFRVAIDGDGNYLKVPLSQYIEYVQNNTERNPLYLFEGELPQQMLNQYYIPHLFPDDILGLLGEIRPQFRWFLIGYVINIISQKTTKIWISLSLRSISYQCMEHITTWIKKMDYVSSIGRQKTTGKHFIEKEYFNICQTPVDYFGLILPKIKQYTDCYIEFIQYANDTVYVPNGWWHAVLNLDHTMAITQNYVQPSSFDQFWISFYKENPSLSQKLFYAIQQWDLNLFQRL